MPLPAIYITNVKAFPCFLDSDSRAKNPNLLDSLSCCPVLGMAAGATRVGLSAIHSIAHLFAALGNYALGKDRYIVLGHLTHAAKGGMEMIVGLIELIPIGFIYAWIADKFFFLIKVENPGAENYTAKKELYRFSVYKDQASEQKLEELKHKKYSAGDDLQADLQILEKIICSPDQQVVKEALEHLKTLTSINPTQALNLLHTLITKDGDKERQAQVNPSNFLVNGPYEQTEETKEKMLAQVMSILESEANEVNINKALEIFAHLVRYSTNKSTRETAFDKFRVIMNTNEATQKKALSVLETSLTPPRQFFEKDRAQIQTTYDYLVDLYMGIVNSHKDNLQIQKNAFSLLSKLKSSVFSNSKIETLLVSTINSILEILPIDDHFITDINSIIGSLGFLDQTSKQQVWEALLIFTRKVITIVNSHKDDLQIQRNAINLLSNLESLVFSNQYIDSNQYIETSLVSTIISFLEILPVADGFTIAIDSIRSSLRCLNQASKKQAWEALLTFTKKVISSATQEDKEAEKTPSSQRKYTKTELIFMRLLDIANDHKEVGLLYPEDISTNPTFISIKTSYRLNPYIDFSSLFQPRLCTPFFPLPHNYGLAIGSSCS